MSTSTGCCGGLFRTILVIINVIFLIVGAIFFGVGAFFKWSDDSWFVQFINDPQVSNILVSNVTDTIGFLLMGFGGFVMLLSIFGFIGAACANRFFLIIYEIITVILFLTHGVGFSLVLIYSPDFENSYRDLMKDFVRQINDPSASPESVTAVCAAYKILSDSINCCGTNDRYDFKNQTLATLCCRDPNSDGCMQMSIDLIKDNVTGYILIPNGVFLVIEFLVVLIVPFLIGRIGRAKLAKRDAESGRVLILPTNYAYQGGNLYQANPSVNSQSYKY